LQTCTQCTVCSKYHFATWCGLTWSYRFCPWSLNRVRLAFVWSFLPVMSLRPLTALPWVLQCPPSESKNHRNGSCKLSQLSYAFMAPLPDQVGRVVNSTV
jgi:hypothetical protein